jgi:heme-degrading monooxygenase HmoA
MYARVTTAIAKPDKFDEVLKIIRDSILPAAKKQKGFKGFYDLADRNTGKGILIVLWDSEADMKAGESSGYYREQVAKVASLLVGAPTMERFEVSVQG